MAKLIDTLDVEVLKVIHSDDYKAYLKALCRLASGYVSRIRVRFAEKAYEMYGNETVRKLVLAYGVEAEKLDEYRLRDFRHVSEFGGASEESLNDDCLNRARDYGKAIWFLFGLDD